MQPINLFKEVLSSEPKRFRCRCKFGLHLTTKGYVDPNEYVAFITQKMFELNKTKFTWYSLVHELGSEGDGYEHTHFAFGVAQPMVFNDARYFDFPGHGHCHIRAIKSKKHAIKLFEDYHRKNPVFLLQSATGMHLPWPAFVHENVFLSDFYNTDSDDEPTFAFDTSVMDDHQQHYNPWFIPDSDYDSDVTVTDNDAVTNHIPDVEFLRTVIDLTN
jgi:hypothetical protein